MNVIKRRLQKKYAAHDDDMQRFIKLLKSNKILGIEWFDSVREYGKCEMADGGKKLVEDEGFADATPEEMMKYYFENIDDFSCNGKWNWEDPVVTLCNGEAVVIKNNDFSDVVKKIVNSMSVYELNDLGFASLK